MFENSCYLKVLESKTWNEAEKECVKLGAHLASIQSEEEMNFAGMLNNLIGLSYIWIGGQRDGRLFRWTDSSPFTYDNWAIGQPDNDGGKENCINFVSYPDDQKIHEKWRDDDCILIGRFACKKQMR